MLSENTSSSYDSAMNCLQFKNEPKSRHCALNMIWNDLVMLMSMVTVVKGLQFARMCIVTLYSRPTCCAEFGEGCAADCCTK